MGAERRATGTELNRDVAVKVIRSTLTGEAARMQSSEREEERALRRYHLEVGPASSGTFLYAGNCSEAIALAGAAIPYSSGIFHENRCALALQWRHETRRFKKPRNQPVFEREYRKGWTLTG